VSLRPSPAPHPSRELISSTGAWLWGFAHATGARGEPAEVALRVAYAEAWPADPPAVADHAGLLAALGRALATPRTSAELATVDDASTADEANPIAVAFRALPWPTQVLVWGRTIEGLDPDTISAALGPAAQGVGDASRLLLVPYLIQLARISPSDCADALRRAATKVQAAAVSAVDDLDPHIAACPSCRFWLPIRVGAQLEAVAPATIAVPESLIEQIAIDREQQVAGVPLAVDAPSSARIPGGAVALAAVALIIVGVALLVLRSNPPRPTLGASAAASTTGVVPSTTAASGPPPTDSGSVALGAVSATSVTTGAPASSPTTTGPTTAELAAAGPAVPAPWPIRDTGHPSPAASPRPPPPSGGTNQKSWLLTGGGGGPWVTTSPFPSPTTQAVPPGSPPPAVPPAVPPVAPPPFFVPPPPPPTTTTTTAAPTTTTTAPTTTTAAPTTTTVAPATPTTTPASLPLPLLPVTLVFVPGIGLPIGARYRRRRVSSHGSDDRT
jgi:hypothetical protein